MKAKIKTTGEIVEVEDLYDDGTALVKDRYFKVSELDFFEDFEAIDWEQRRYEIAKSAMQGMLAHSTNLEIQIRIGIMPLRKKLKNYQTLLSKN